MCLLIYTYNNILARIMYKIIHEMGWKGHGGVGGGHNFKVAWKVY